MLFNKMIESYNLSLNNGEFSKKIDDSSTILPGNFKPRFYDDIKISLLFENATPEIYCVGTVESDNYIKIDKSKLEFMKTLINITDGEKTIDDIERILSSIYTLSSYRNFFAMLGEYGLIKNYKIKNKDKSNIFFINLLFINISKFCSTIKYIVPSILSLFKLAYIFVFSVLLGLIITGVINVNTIFQVDSSSIIETTIMTFLYIVPTIFTHELSHMFVAIKYNLLPNQMRFSLYMFIYPMIYVVIPGIYFLKRKERIWILSAGVIWNSFFMMLCIIIGNVFSINTIKIIAYSNLIVMIMNLIPFFLSDGYFILCNLMKTSNIRRDFTLFLISFRNKDIDRKKILKSKFSVFYIIISSLFLTYGLYEIGTNTYSFIYDFLNSRWSIKLNEIFFVPMSISIGVYIFFILMFSNNNRIAKKKKDK